MTFGATPYEKGDLMAEYLNSAGTSGLAAALSGRFEASPTFMMSQADDPALSAAFAGTGLSKARNIDAGALTYDQALNYAPKGGPAISLKEALGEFDPSSGFSTLVLLVGGGYIGYRQRENLISVLIGAMVGLGLQQILQKFMQPSK